MTRRRIIFRNTTAAPAAAHAAPTSVRMPTAPVMFLKAIMPAPDPLNAIDWTCPITGDQFDTLAKAAAVGEIGMDDLARASEASLCRGVVPDDLRRVIVGTHLDPLR
jgi:hypothetical protein